MKFISVAVLTFILSGVAHGQALPKADNIFIITSDGLRWQEVFEGASPEIISNPTFVQDTALLKNLYNDSTAMLRRKKLMPFFWDLIAEHGQLYGNRNFGNKVNVSNFFKISYPGYNEMLTGHADPIFIPNIPINNRSINVLEYLNRKPAYQGRIAVFSSWNIFPFILNEKRNGLPMNSGYSQKINKRQDSADVFVQKLEENIDKKTHTRFDLLTYFSARQYIGQEHPRVLMLGLGETDEFAHNGRYDLYLQQITAFDKMIAELWYYVQTDPFYKDNTIFIITSDHGRGKKPDRWSSHGLLTAGSGEIWLAVLGPGIKPTGEVKTNAQFWQGQIAPTIALLIGERFSPPHKVSPPLNIPMESDYSPNTVLSSFTK
jgi:hypothetical protein